MNKMGYSSLRNAKPLRQANYFLLALNTFLALQLVVALMLTHKGIIPGFSDIKWFSNTIFSSIFFFIALCGGIFIYASIYCYHQNNSWSFLIVGILLTTLYIVKNIFFPESTYAIANPIAIIIWLACLASLIWGTVSLKKNERDSSINLLLTFTLLPLFILASSFFLALTIIYHPNTQDTLLMAIDATLGLQPSFLAGQWFAYLPSLIILLIKTIYLGLPFALAVVYIGRYFQAKHPPFELIIEFFLIGLFGMLLYHINTGCGPINAFKPHWPQQIPIVPMQPKPELCIGTFLPRNCLPSLHTAWVVCLWRHSLPCTRRIRWLITFWVICTLAGTLGLGEHYLVDLLVGFAFASFTGGLCAINLSIKQPARYMAIVGGALICIGWYLLINFGLELLRISPFIAWFFYSSSVLLTCLLEFKLTSAQKLEDTE